MLASREVIKGRVDLCALSKGGARTRTQSDYGKPGAMLKGQHQRLQEFDGGGYGTANFSQSAAYRAKLYINSAGRCYERAKRRGTDRQDG